MGLSLALSPISEMQFAIFHGEHAHTYINDIFPTMTP